MRDRSKSHVVEKPSDTCVGIEPTLKKKQKKVSRMDKLSVDMMMGPP